MKKLLPCLALLLGLVVSASAEQLKGVFNSQTGKNDWITAITTNTITPGTNVTVTCTNGACTVNSSGSGGGPATLPLPEGATNYIQNTSTLQSGATFYVSSGTVAGKFSTVSGNNSMAWDPTGITPAIVTNGRFKIQDTSANIYADLLHLQTGALNGIANPTARFSEKLLTTTGLYFQPNLAGFLAFIPPATIVSTTWTLPGADNVGAFQSDGSGNMNISLVSLSSGVTGVLPVANGGTGTASPGLVAGTNITSITGTWPNQTINAATQSGGGGGSPLETLFGTARSSPTATLRGSVDFLGSVTSSTMTVSMNPVNSAINTLASSITVLGAGGFAITSSSAAQDVMTEGADSTVSGAASGVDLFWASSSSHTLVFNPNNTSTYTVVGSSVNDPSGVCAQFSGNGQLIPAPNGSACGTGSGGGGIVSPGTFTWTNNFGILVSTIQASSTTIMPGTTIQADGLNGGNIALISSGVVNAFKITANGTYGTTNGTSGGLLLDCSGGLGFSGMCSQFYSNAGAQQALDALVYIRANNSAWNEPLLYISNASSAAQSTIRIDSGWPTISYIDTSQPSGASGRKFQESVHNGNLRLEGRNTVDSAFDSAIIISSMTAYGDVSIGQGYNSATATQLQVITSTSNTNIITLSTSPVGVNLMAVSTSPAINPTDFLLTVSSISGTLNFGVQNNAHVISSGTIPTVSSCGTSPSVDGNSTDFAGKINVGSVTATACTVTFASAFANPPICIVSDDSTGVTADIQSVTSSAVTFGFSVSLAGGHVYYICVGAKG